MEERKIEYHSSYTDEENRMLQDYIENASEKELVELVEKLQELYTANVPSISASLKQLQKEVQERDILKQQYEALKKCRTEWQNYQKALFNYKDAIIIRKKYIDFKKEYTKKDVLNQFLGKHEEDPEFQNISDDRLRKALLSDGAKWQTKKPESPHSFYSNVDEIDVTPLSDSESLENIGKDNLKYLIMIMLYHVDSPTAIEIPVAISFLTRKYAETNHKQKNNLPVFATNLLSIPELNEKNQELLKDISFYKRKSDILLTDLEEIE